ncbi:MULTISPECIES: epoxide hydrolase family protein [Paraburkholderia]|uniref:epoxide hydrolase family protein n=1 Tax=Paraburkholderia TaxID=1822464 RepID=UPI002259A87B|nr:MULTISPECIES: epoxide hydrolase family protein [Paraburkholderia]MCX4163641.1 epoxide hydrolase [Paraburkholderia megapolitana]MDN7159136.1 epoxide hydrolase [Paraburkholderia sp. CHISQ3]MDQ6496183.1 epoxide hydrolase [Paraburkholderia megapolitana]
MKNSYLTQVPNSRRRVLQGIVGAAATLGVGLSGLAQTRSTPMARANVTSLTLPPASDAIESFSVHVPQSLLDDLKQRLETTRWPDRETVQDWSQGVPLERMKSVVEYWRTSYDWRSVEKTLNSFAQFRTLIDGLGIHFLHVRSPHPDALPIVLTHGWPGSVIEFLKVIRPLTDPTSHGGSAKDAFHVVVPSLPGFGFSDKPTTSGWNIPRIAQAWAQLMKKLGYARWVAQGGDFGAGVTTALGHLRPQGLAAIHLNWQFVFPEKIPDSGLTPDEARAVAQANAFLSKGYGYFLEQSTRPQTVGYGLADSPAGQAAWIYEKFQAWTDSNGDPETVLSRSQILDDISLYWLTDTSASSARIYWENFPASFAGGRIDLPVAATAFPKEIYQAPRSWAERDYPDLIYWHEAERGGHFAAFEQPEIFVRELRAAFRTLRV